MARPVKRKSVYVFKGRWGIHSCVVCYYDALQVAAYTNKNQNKNWVSGRFRAVQSAVIGLYNDKNRDCTCPSLAPVLTKNATLSTPLTFLKEKAVFKIGSAFFACCVCRLFLVKFVRLPWDVNKLDIVVN